MVDEQFVLYCQYKTLTQHKFSNYVRGKLCSKEVRSRLRIILLLFIIEFLSSSCPYKCVVNKCLQVRTSYCSSFVWSFIIFGNKQFHWFGTCFPTVDLFLTMDLIVPFFMSPLFEYYYKVIHVCKCLQPWTLATYCSSFVWTFRQQLH